MDRGSSKAEAQLWKGLVFFTIPYAPVWSLFDSDWTSFGLSFMHLLFMASRVMIERDPFYF